MFIHMSRADAVARMQEAHQRMEQLGGKHRMSKADEAEFESLRQEFDELTEHVERLDRRSDIAKAARGEGRLRLERGTAGEDDRPATAGTRDAVLRCLDDKVRIGTLAERSAETVERLIGKGDTWVARWAAATGDAAYERASRNCSPAGRPGTCAGPHKRPTPTAASKPCAMSSGPSASADPATAAAPWCR